MVQVRNEYDHKWTAIQKFTYNTIGFLTKTSFSHHNLLEKYGISTSTDIEIVGKRAIKDRALPRKTFVYNFFWIQVHIKVILRIIRQAPSNGNLSVERKYAASNSLSQKNMKFCRVALGHKMI